MPTQRPTVDSTPIHVDRAPFASESGLQHFVETNSEALLGLKVLASSRLGGGGVFKIDILAADKAGRPWIIECKHDLVDSSALRQLRRYQASLLNGWNQVASRFGALDLAAVANPVLALVGYRFDGNVGGDDCARLAYRYHDMEFTDNELQSQRSGRVSLRCADEVLDFDEPHPKVSKELATGERLRQYAPALEDSFKQIAKNIEDLGVTVTYGGKNFVRFSTAAGVFAEAVVRDGAVEWRVTSSHWLRNDSDAAAIVDLLRNASGKAAG